MAESSMNMTKDRLIKEIEAAKEVAWSISKKGESESKLIGWINIVTGVIGAGSSGVLITGFFGAASLPIVTGLAAAVSACASGYLVIAKSNQNASEGKVAAAELEKVRNLLRFSNVLTVEQAIEDYNQIQKRYPSITEAAMTALRMNARS